MKPQVGGIRSAGEMASYGKKVQARTKGFGKPKADRYAKDAEGRMGKFVKERKGL